MQIRHRRHTRSVLPLLIGLLKIRALFYAQVLKAMDQHDCSENVLKQPSLDYSIGECRTGNTTLSTKKLLIIGSVTHTATVHICTPARLTY